MKILIIEDQETIRELMSEFLSILGYVSLEAVDPQTAKSIVENNASEIGIVICDVLLGKTQGPTLMKELRKWIPNAVVIFTSGFSTQDVLNGDESSSSLFLPKPFSLECLRNTLFKAISMA